MPRARLDITEFKTSTLTVLVVLGLGGTLFHLAALFGLVDIPLVSHPLSFFGVAWAVLPILLFSSLAWCFFTALQIMKSLRTPLTCPKIAISGWGWRFGLPWFRLRRALLEREGYRQIGWIDERFHRFFTIKHAVFWNPLQCSYAFLFSFFGWPKFYLMAIADSALVKTGVSNRPPGYCGPRYFDSGFKDPEKRLREHHRELADMRELADEHRDDNPGLTEVNIQEAMTLLRVECVLAARRKPPVEIGGRDVQPEEIAGPVRQFLLGCKVPFYGDPESPSVEKLANLVLIDAIKKDVQIVLLEWRLKQEDFRSMLDECHASETGARTESLDPVVVSVDGYMAILHVFDIGHPLVVMLPPAKLWRTMKHRLLLMAGLDDDPKAGELAAPYTGLIRLMLGEAHGCVDFEAKFEPLEGGQRLMLRRV